MTSRIDNFRRILMVMRHFDSSFEEVCKVCGKCKLYPYDKSMQILELNGDRHDLCHRAVTYQEFDMVNRLYYSKDD